MKTRAADRESLGPSRLVLRTVLEERYGALTPRFTPFYETADKGVYRVDRGRGAPWVLRHYPATRPMERLHGQVAIMRHVERHAIPAERVVPTSDGADAVELDGRGVLVTTLLEGTVPRRTPESLRRLGESIGRIHALPPGSPEDPWLARPAGAMPREDLAFGRSCLERIRGRVPAEHRPAYESLVSTLQQTRDGTDLPPSAFGLLHSDCHMANAAEPPDGSVAWFDWDGAGLGPCMAALGLLLYSCGVRYPGERASNGATREPSTLADRVEAVLSGYLPFHQPSDAELDYLPDAVRFRPAVVAARELAAAIEQGFAVDHAGWWDRYTDADAVAACAQRFTGRPRARAP